LESEKAGFTLITQNIDGLHQLARSSNTIEIHGNLWQIRCTICGVIEQSHDVQLKDLPPPCKKLWRSRTPECCLVWRDNTHVSNRQALLAIEKCEVMIIVGTSVVVEPAASMGLVAKQTGKTVIEVNIEPTVNSQLYDLTVIGKSGEILPMFCN
jgi:NAD-dependent deacetylase